MVSNRARGVGIGRAAAGLLLCVLMAATGGWTAVAKAPVEKIDGNSSRTRFVIALDRDASFQVSSLSQPNRVVVDLPEIRYGLPPPVSGEPVGLIKGFRGGLAAPGKVKVVIDVTAPVIVERAALEPAADGHGPRLVLEIVPVDSSRPAAKTFAGARIGNVGLSEVQPPLPKRAAKPADRAARTFKPTIVLDPGHGGHDSGAQRHGVVEKDAVLAFSLVLRDRLKATNRYRVMMTREDDTFVPLDDRREFAEKNKAALFMAIHADYAGSNASGATIYSLRDSAARGLTRSAIGEVVKSVLSEKEMKDIKGTEGADASVVRGFLADLAQREVESTTTRTSMLARSVIEHMRGSTPMMSNPERSAGYNVLQTAKVPAVLLELAFVSNKQDAANLKSEAWRRKVAEAIVEAIDNYFSSQVAKLPM
ncbi:MAG: N-acetylmuramoyl-L-alanine amidase [Hyphomicrobiaceae bacterium]|nr:N-acetylmuramoyl-L-alanine amidase [Hyphomicrobiaceae bacterium]